MCELWLHSDRMYANRHNLLVKTLGSSRRLFSRWCAERWRNCSIKLLSGFHMTQNFKAPRPPHRQMHWIRQLPSRSARRSSLTYACNPFPNILQNISPNPCPYLCKVNARVSGGRMPRNKGGSLLRGHWSAIPVNLLPFLILIF